MFECDFPHGDSTWPNTAASLAALADATGLGDDEVYKLARGNAITCYGLHRHGSRFERLIRDGLIRDGSVGGYVLRRR
jgi:hypothetical protein